MAADQDQRQIAARRWRIAAIFSALAGAVFVVMAVMRPSTLYTILAVVWIVLTAFYIWLSWASRPQPEPRQ